MTEQDYKKASEIMAEIDILRKQLEALPRTIANPFEYNKSNHKFGYVKRTLRKIKNKFDFLPFRRINYRRKVGSLCLIGVPLFDAFYL